MNAFGEEGIAWHPEPLYRDVPAYMVHVGLEPGGRFQKEQLWTRQLDEGLELRCVPFFAYELAVGDVFVVQADLAHEVIRASGHGVARILAVAEEQQTINRLRHLLGDEGYRFEESPIPGIFAVDLPSENAQQKLDSAIAQFVAEGLVHAELGKAASA